MNKRVICAAVLLMTLGCSGDDDPGKSTLACSSGSRLALETVDVCVYRNPLLVETGFNCPAEAQYGSSYGDLTVCSPEENLPNDFFDEVAEQFPDDVPTGDCMAVVCNLGQVCSAGSCVSAEEPCEGTGCEESCWGRSVDDCPEETCAVELGTPYDEEQECYGPGTPMYCAPAGMNCANNTSTVLDPDGACYFTGSSECPVPDGWTAEDGVVSCPSLDSVPECG